MTTKLYGILILYLLLECILATPSRVHACGEPTRTLKFEDVDAVFAGRVVEVSLPSKWAWLWSPRAWQATVDFQVSTVWKGPSIAHLTVYVDEWSEKHGTDFDVGKEYLVYAYDDEGSLEMPPCSTPKLLQNAQADLQALGQGQKPALSFPPASTPFHASPFIIIGGVSFMMMLIGSLLFAWYRRLGLDQRSE